MRFRNRVDAGQQVRAWMTDKVEAFVQLQVNAEPSPMRHAAAERSRLAVAPLGQPSP